MAAFGSSGGLSLLESKREFAIEIWNGFIPIEFSLAESDLSATESPDPYYTSVSRYSYISAAAEDVVSFFRTSAVDLSSHVWFEYQGVPLRANVPIGCLFDMHGDGGILPWKVVVHFQWFPMGKIIMCCCRDDARRYFYHGLKQCMFILYGNLRSFSQLTEEDQTRLWESIAGGERLSFDVGVKGLIESRDSVRKVPLRAYVSVLVATGRGEEETEGGSGLQLSSSSGDATPSLRHREYQLVQVSVPKRSIVGGQTSSSSSSDEFTVSEVLLRYILPSCIAANTLSCSPEELMRSTRVTCHGVDLDPTFDMCDAWELFRYADLFMYWTVCVHIPVDSCAEVAATAAATERLQT